MSWSLMAFIMINKFRFIKIEVLVGEHKKPILFGSNMHALNVESLGTETWVKIVAHPHGRPVEVPISLGEQQPRKIYDEIWQVQAFFKPELWSCFELQNVIKSCCHHGPL